MRFEVRRQALRWSTLGLVFTLLIAVVCVALGTRVASEQRAHTLATAAAFAFRPMILEGNVRDAQFQMRKTLELGTGDSVVVRDLTYNAVYPLQESDANPRCQSIDRVCWTNGFRSISVLQPIYFDEDRRTSLYGYLEVTTRPMVDWKTLSLIGFLAVFAFVVQALGLSAEIRRAREQAQASLLRQVGHDLKTPLSQLEKFLLVHFDQVREEGKVDEEVEAQIFRSVQRASSLVRQIGQTSKSSRRTEEPQVCEIGTEVSLIAADLAQDNEAISKGVQLAVNVENGVPKAFVRRTDFYRVLENLFRNAVQSAPRSGSKITVELRSLDGFPTLSVKDNGPGIAQEIQNKIFDSEFTTRPGQGSGLGLSIVKRICDENGARVHLRSAPNQGAEFQVRFKPLEAVSL